MRGKYLICGLIACLCLASSALTGQAEQLQKASPKNVGFTVLPITGVDPSGPAALDPAVPVSGVAVAVVPEPATIAMLFLGSGCLGALTVLRRRRRRG